MLQPTWRLTPCPCGPSPHTAHSIHLGTLSKLLRAVSECSALHAAYEVVYTTPSEASLWLHVLRCTSAMLPPGLYLMLRLADGEVLLLPTGPSAGRKRLGRPTIEEGRVERKPSMLPLAQQRSEHAYMPPGQSLPPPSNSAVGTSLSPQALGKQARGRTTLRAPSVGCAQLYKGPPCGGQRGTKKMGPKSEATEPNNLATRCTRRSSVRSGANFRDEGGSQARHPSNATPGRAGPGRKASPSNDRILASK